MYDSRFTLSQNGTHEIAYEGSYQKLYHLNWTSEQISDGL